MKPGKSLKDCVGHHDYDDVVGEFFMVALVARGRIKPYSGPGFRYGRELAVLIREALQSAESVSLRG